MIVAACGLLIPEIRGADLRRRELI